MWQLRQAQPGDSVCNGEQGMKVGKEGRNDMQGWRETGEASARVQEALAPKEHGFVVPQEDNERRKT